MNTENWALLVRAISDNLPEKVTFELQPNIIEKAKGTSGHIESTRHLRQNEVSLFKEQQEDPSG